MRDSSSCPRYLYRGQHPRGRGEGVSDHLQVETNLGTGTYVGLRGFTVEPPIEAQKGDVLLYLGDRVGLYRDGSLVSTHECKRAGG